MNTNQRYSKHAAALLMTGCSLTTTPAVFAADESSSDARVEELVVTGSRIARSDASSVGAMTTMTAADIAQVAPTSIGDVLQQMPSVGVSLNSNGTQGTSFGVSAINLRYLGSAEGSGNRTLVLVDGHRWVNAVGGRGFRDFVDLNTIPLGIIERVEVLKDGASAIYGADAIAGVVNIHTLKELDGLQVTARVGQSSRDDGENYSGYLNWGRRMDRSSVLLSVSYNDSKPIFTDDRDLTRRAMAPLTAAPSSPRGLFVLPGLSNNAYFGTPAGFANNAANAVTLNTYGGGVGSAALADNSFHVARLPGDDYNTMAQGLYATGPSERIGVYGRFNYDLTDSTSAYIDALYNKRESAQLFSPVPLDIRGSNGFAISNDQAFNPFGTANGVPLANALGFSGNAFRIQRVPIEVGNRDTRQEVTTYRVAAGLEGTLQLAGEWRWDAFLSWAKNEADFDSFNQVNFENIYQALRSPAACAAAAGCTPLNLFGTITPEMASYIRFNGHDENSAEQYDFAANVSRSLFALPGGELGIAAGYEYRKESASDRPDPFASTPSSILPLVNGLPQLRTSLLTRDGTSGSYDLHEIYTELNAPLLANIPGIYQLDVDAAVRYSQYSSVGGKATSKFGVAYRPIEDVLVRGTFSEGFRAPSILELFQPQRRLNLQGVDPCNGGGAGLPGCAGVPVAYNQNQFNNGLLDGLSGGNPQLEPETAQTLSVGIAITPSALRGMSVTVDWFEITVNDAIASQTATQILNSCAISGTFCDLFQRAPTGEITGLTQTLANLNQIRVAGIDATTRYEFATPIGEFEAVLDISYLDKFQTFVPQPDGSIAIDDRAGKSDQPRSTFPHWKGQAALSYSLDAINASWRTRYVGASDDIPDNAINGGRIDATYFHDLQLGYSFAERNVKVALGVDNVLDELPPASAANNPINFDIYTYDVRGRYYYVRLAAEF